MAGSAVDAVVFDYGGVLTTPVRSCLSAWLAAESIDEDSFVGTMREWLARDVPFGSPVHLLETGELPVTEFERRLAARLTTTDGTPVPAKKLLTRLFAELSPDPAMAALLRDVRAAGLRTGLLSNSWGDTYPNLVHELCDVVVISGREGLRKPDPRIYRLVLERLGVPAERCAFVDDAPINVEAAAALGFRATRHRDPGTTRAALADLIPALTQP